MSCQHRPNCDVVMCCGCGDSWRLFSGPMLFPTLILSKSLEGRTRQPVTCGRTGAEDLKPLPTPETNRERVRSFPVEKRTAKAFTLIELLIVVAIIAILAAIAVPNFLEAQTRAKVSRAKADMRTMATGLESYYVDNNRYPINPSNSPTPTVYPSGLRLLSTPIAYLTDPLLQDVFLPPQVANIVTGSGGSFVANIFDKTYQYSLRGQGSSGLDQGISGQVAGQQGRWWLLRSHGPDRDADAYSTPIQTNDIPGVVNKIYDPTNGTVSDGNIYRVGGAPEQEAGKQLQAMSSR